MTIHARFHRIMRRESAVFELDPSFGKRIALEEARGFSLRRDDRLEQSIARVGLVRLPYPAQITDADAAAVHGRELEAAFDVHGRG
ncbi:MAG: hypothetical protein WC641_08335 [Patescibacteria group bacterium]